MPNTGLEESLVHGHMSQGRYYDYRSQAGIIPSGEYAVFFDDFFLAPASNAVVGATAIVDAGAALVAAAADGKSYHGCIKISSTVGSEGVANYWPLGIQLGLGKKFFMEVRVLTDDADDTDVQFGLSIANATSNPEDLYTTASTDLVTFGVLDGDATVQMLCDKNNAGASATTGDIDLEDGVWHILAIEVGGRAANSTMWCKGYVDGELAETWGTETSIPDDCALAPFFAARNGGDTAHVIYFDYVRWSVER